MHMLQNMRCMHVVKCVGRKIIKNAICFHASGPYYAKKFGYLKTEIEKYQNSDLPSFVEHYKTFLDKKICLNIVII